MKDEIKEILDRWNLVADNKLTHIDLTRKQMKILGDYITNLHVIEKEHKNCSRKHWQQKCAEHCANEMIYKSRNEKAIEFCKKYDFILKWQLLEILEGEDKDE